MRTKRIKPPSLLDALDDPALFGRVFQGRSWDPWRTFCRALTGQPMGEAELALFQRCTGRTMAPTRPARECWVVSGRRSGKSLMAAAVASYLAALAPTDRLTVGEQGVVLICATDMSQAKVVFHYVKGLFEAPALRGLVVSETTWALHLKHQVRIEVRSSSFRRVRGVTLLAAVLDEIAFFRAEESALPDKELFRALLPALATTQGLILGISSPWGRHGLLWEKYQRHWGDEGATTLVWQSDSLTMNPTLDAAQIAADTAADPEAAQAEWAGQFRADLETYLSTEVVERCTTPGVTARPPRPGVSYTAFCDPAAGTGKDSFVLAIAHREESSAGEIAVLDCVREIRPPFDPLAVVANDLVPVLRVYGCTDVQSDAYAGGWVVTTFARHGIACAQDAEAKSQLYLAALPLFTATRVDLLDMAKLKSQLVAIERRRRAGGRDIVDHGPAGFDDLANAVVGVILRAVNVGVAWWAKPPTGPNDRMGGNAAPERRRRLLDEREFDLLWRGL